MEAELQCLRAVGGLEERMRNACHAPNASYESLITVWLLHPYCDWSVPITQNPDRRFFSQRSRFYLKEVLHIMILDALFTGYRWSGGWVRGIRNGIYQVAETRKVSAKKVQIP